MNWWIDPGVKAEMALDQNPPSSAARPLWVIAIALTAIAACLIVLVLRKEPVREPVGGPVSDVHSTRFHAQLDLNPPPKSTNFTTPLFARPRRSSPATTARPPPPALMTSGRIESLGLESVRSGTMIESIPGAPAGFAPGGFAPQNGSLVAGHAGGKIIGRVTLAGTPPPDKEIEQASHDAFCGNMHAMLKTRHYLVSRDGGLADVFVAIVGPVDYALTDLQSEVVVDQTGCEFEPYVFGVVAGQHVSFKNSDRIVHEVRATRVSWVSDEFDFILKPLETRSHTFNWPIAANAPLRIRCGLHPWMYSYCFVMGHPFFAVTDREGNFTIRRVPPGKYELWFHHRAVNARETPSQKPVTVSADSVTRVDLTLTVPRS